MKNNRIFYFILALLLSSCGKEDKITPEPEANLLKISIEKGSFENSEGDSFFPWGFNYTNPEGGVGLIDDNWLDGEIWDTILEDFMEMKALGANVVRIHLQYNKFMEDEDTPNESALERLSELVKFAEELKIYLDITGLGAYRASDQPSYYSNMNDDERWETQALFWASIAEKVGSSPAVFAFNLMNEPVVSVGCITNNNCEWLPGNGFGGFHFVQNITRTEGNKFAETLKDWILVLTQSIRSKDVETLITVGFLSLGNYSQFGADLDYLSPHIYPKTGEIDEAIQQVVDNHSNIPVVIEETSNLHCGIVELEEFLKSIEGRYQGLMGHYFGTTIEDLTENTIINALRRNFLQFFIDNNPN